MKNEIKKDRDISVALMGILTFVLGGLLIAATEELITTFNYVLVCIFGLVGVVEIINFFINKDYLNNYYGNLLIGCTFIWLALIFYKYYMVIINILPILFSLYLFIMGAVLLIKYNLLKTSDNKFKVYMIMGIFALLVGVLLIFEPLWSVFVYLRITGVYVVMLSLLYFYEFIKNIKVNINKKDN